MTVPYLDYAVVRHHKSMLSDKARDKAFEKAIAQVVKPGDVVADVGAGLGFLSFAAARAGARRVYAIERTPIIRLAQAIAKYNDFSNIEFVKADATRVRLPKKCDVIVSECIGYFALQENMITDVLAFAKRNLKHGGKIIPQSIDLFLAPVQSKEAYSNVSFWENVQGVEYAPMRRVAENSTFQPIFSKRDFLAVPKRVARLPLKPGTHVALDARASFKAQHPGVLHGLCGYFNARLAQGVAFSNAPGTTTHWKQEFFPLATPVFVKKGKRISVRVQAVPLVGKVNWNWLVTVDKMVQAQSTLRGIRLKESPFSASEVNPDALF